jgi:hypothetical protein
MKKLIVATLLVAGVVSALPAVAGPIIVTQPSVERAAQPPATLQDAGWRRGWHRHHGWRHRHWRHRHW